MPQSRFFFPTLLPTAIALFTASSSSAATETWEGGAAAANWSDAANRNADGTPTSSHAALLDNSFVNPLLQINAQSGAIRGTFLNYAGATPLVSNLYGASINAAKTGPLLRITTNAPTSLTANKINFQVRLEHYNAANANDLNLVSPGTAVQNVWHHAAVASEKTAELADPLVSGPDADKDRDGIVNLLECAMATNPGLPDSIPASAERNGPTFEFSYTRNNAATDLVFTVKWSDGMKPGSWTPSGIANQNPDPIPENAQTETLRISVPVGSNRRFVRLEITKP